MWLKLDSGMNRLGFKLQDWLQAYQTLKTCRWAKSPIVLMSHLAEADSLDSNETQAQQLMVDKLAKETGLPVSLANSAGILNGQQFHYKWVRPGLMLYGVSPLLNQDATDLGLKPVMRFESCLFNIKYCNVGEKVGYGGTFKASRVTRIGYVAVGYGDGYPWTVTESAYVLVDGVKSPIIGRVSMDILTIDITDISQAAIGSHVQLWGGKLPIENVAKFANTSHYELLCRAPLQKRSFL